MRRVDYFLFCIGIGSAFCSLWFPNLVSIHIFGFNSIIFLAILIFRHFYEKLSISYFLQENSHLVPLLICNFLILLHNTISWLNFRGIYDPNLLALLYRSDYNKWLPTTIDKVSTFEIAVKNLYLSIFFWASAYSIFSRHKSSGYSKNKFNACYNTHRTILSPIFLLCTVNICIEIFVGILPSFDIIYSNLNKGSGLFNYDTNACVLYTTCIASVYGSAINENFPSSRNKILVYSSICFLIFGVSITESRLGFLLLGIIIPVVFFDCLHNSFARRDISNILILFILLVTSLTVFVIFSDKFNVPQSLYNRIYSNTGKLNNIELKFLIYDDPESNIQICWVTDNTANYSSSNGIQVVVTPSNEILIKTKIQGIKENVYKVDTTGKFPRHVNLDLDLSRGTAKYEINDSASRRLKLVNSSKLVENKLVNLRCAIINHTPYIKLEDLVLNYKDYKYDFFTFSNTIIRHTNTFTRNVIFHNSINMVKDFWIFGCGAGAWNKAYLNYRGKNDTWEYWVHSDPIQFLIEYGLITFSWIILLILFSLFLQIKITGKSKKNIVFEFLPILLILISCLIDFSLQVFPIQLSFLCFFLIYLNIKPSQINSKLRL